MTTAIDFHTHFFRDSFEKWSDSDQVQAFRHRAKSWFRPVASTLHRLQTGLRHFPEFFRKRIDEVGGVIPLPGLLIESTYQDLIEAMDEANVEKAVVIAHPPFISNEYLLEVCGRNPRFIPAVNVSKGASGKSAQLLRSYAKKGARILKIHAASDGEGPDSPRYRALLRAGSDLGMSVILHTGCIHSHLLYRDPQQGRAEFFSKWFETYSQTQFVLAHMNFHEPGVALDLCEEFKNLWVDTSWQPAEVIGEATRRIGAERVLFGSDWPLVGNNLLVGRKRVEDCIETGLLNEHQAELILRGNALNLLGLNSNGN